LQVASWTLYKNTQMAYSGYGLVQARVATLS
jgi:hypothetical protein